MSGRSPTLGAVRRTRKLGVVGVVVIVLSSALAAVAVAQVVGLAVGRGTRLAQAAVQQGPFEEQVELAEGTWILYQCEGGPGCPEPVAVEEVLVDGATGTRLTVRPDRGTDTITRGVQDFSAVARVEVPEDQTYLVVVPARTRFVLAPSPSSLVAPSLVWAAVGLVAGLGLLTGIVLLVVGLVLGARARRTAT